MRIQNFRNFWQIVVFLLKMVLYGNLCHSSRAKTLFYLELISIQFSQATKISKCLGNCCFIVKNPFPWKYRSFKLKKAEFYLDFGNIVANIHHSIQEKKLYSTLN